MAKMVSKANIFSVTFLFDLTENQALGEAIEDYVKRYGDSTATFRLFRYSINDISREQFGENFFIDQQRDVTLSANWKNSLNIAFFYRSENGVDNSSLVKNWINVFREKKELLWSQGEWKYYCFEIADVPSVGMVKPLVEALRDNFSDPEGSGNSNDVYPFFVPMLSGFGDEGNSVEAGVAFMSVCSTDAPGFGLTGGPVHMIRLEKYIPVTIDEWKQKSSRKEKMHGLLYNNNTLSMPRWDNSWDDQIKPYSLESVPVPMSLIKNANAKVKHDFCDELTADVTAKIKDSIKKVIDELMKRLAYSIDDWKQDCYAFLNNEKHDSLSQFTFEGGTFNLAALKEFQNVESVSNLSCEKISPISFSIDDLEKAVEDWETRNKRVITNWRSEYMNLEFKKKVIQWRDDNQEFISDMKKEYERLSAYINDPSRDPHRGVEVFNDICTNKISTTMYDIFMVRNRWLFIHPDGARIQATGIQEFESALFENNKNHRVLIAIYQQGNNGGAI